MSKRSVCCAVIAGLLCVGLVVGVQIWRRRGEPSSLKILTANSAADRSASGPAVSLGRGSNEGRYSGMCDASAAVPLPMSPGNNATFIVADDERNTLCVYRSLEPGGPICRFPWDAHLGIDLQTDEHPEADLEGATVLGSHIYWIASHGRNKDGRWRPNRHQFFAMTIRRGSVTPENPDGLVARPFGKPRRDLILHLVADAKMGRLGGVACPELVEALAVGDKKAKKLAPKKEGLNVEGLCAAADGKSLLIALRNPRPGGEALLVPLLNPAAVVSATSKNTDGARPQFGAPIRLRLQITHEGEPVALGIRSIEYSPRHAAYLIAAGPHDTRRVFALYRWPSSGGNTGNDGPPVLLPKSTALINGLEDFSPEALIVYPDRDRGPHPGAIQVLSDDGALTVKVASPAECKPGTFDNGECQAKDLNDDRRKTFKSVWIDVE